MATPYGNFEVITYGAGTQFVSAFQSVALMAGAGVTGSLVQVALLTGLLMGIFQAVAHFRGNQLLKWFVMVVVIQGVFWVPKVTVHVTDRWNAGLINGDVANVPLVLGLVASVSTQVEDYAITNTQTMFGDPASLSFSNAGMVYGPRLFSGIGGMQISDPVLSQNTGQFMTDCVMDDLLQGKLSLDRIMNSPNTWAELTSSMNPALMTTFVSYSSDKSSVTKAPVTCVDALASINAALTSEIANQEKFQVNSLFGWLSPAAGGSAAPTNPAPSASSAVQDFSARALGTGISTSQLYSQALTASVLSQMTSEFGSKSPGSNPITAVAELQGQIQAHASAQSSGATARRTIQVMQIVLELLLISVFPILFPAFLLPGIGPSLIKNYFGSFIFLQLWGPLLVILNEIFMAYGSSAITGVAYLPAGASFYGGQYAVTYRNIAAVAKVSQDVSDLAGWAMMSIPVIAGMLTKGLSMAGEGMGALAGGSASGVSLASSMMATGNVSRENASFDNVNMGNTSLWNRSGFNDTAQQENLRPTRTRFGSVQDFADGLMDQQTGQGRHLITVPTGRLLTSLNAQESLANSLSAKGMQIHESAKAITSAHDRAHQVAQQVIAGHGGGTRIEGNIGDNSGIDARQHFSQVISEAQGVSKSFGKQFGIDERDAQSLVFGWLAEGGFKGSGKIGTPSILPAGAELGAEGRVGVRAAGDHSTTWGRLTQEQSNWLATNGSSLLRSQSAAEDSYATKMLTNQRGVQASTDFRNQRMSSSSSDWRVAVQQMERVATSFQEDASKVRSGSATMTRNLDNDLQSVMYDFYDHGDFGLIGRPPTRGEFLNPSYDNPYRKQILDIQDRLAQKVFDEAVDRYQVEKAPENFKGQVDTQLFDTVKPNGFGVAGVSILGDSSNHHRVPAAGGGHVLETDLERAKKLFHENETNSRPTDGIAPAGFLTPKPGGPRDYDWQKVEHEARDGGEIADKESQKAAVAGEHVEQKVGFDVDGLQRPAQKKPPKGGRH